MITLTDCFDMINVNIEDDDGLKIGERCSLRLEEHEMAKAV